MLRRVTITSMSIGITTPTGFRASGTTCGIKKSGKPDMALIVADRPCSVAGVFSTNRFPGAPVVLGRERVSNGIARAIVINSGIANDATGQQGLDNARQTARLTAELLTAAGSPVDAEAVLPSSTGVIGPQLPMDKVREGVRQLVDGLGRGGDADDAAARGIMTTDLVPKSAGEAVALGDGVIHMAGIAKGSGMIAPNMATMLAFLTCDADIHAAPLQAAVRAAVEASFNRISVDAHTSPSDTVLVLARPSGLHRRIEDEASPLFIPLREGLTRVCRDLAYKIIRDGEGATRVFRVRIEGAATEAAADAVGRAVVDSPLVKAAVHGSDPNWGRIITAIGNADAGFAADAVTLSISGGPHQGAPVTKPVTVFARNTPADPDTAQLATLQEAMQQPEVQMHISLGDGPVDVEWLGCDLSYDYVRINAEYTT